MPADFIARLPELEQAAKEHERKARALRQIIEGVRALNGDAVRLLSNETEGGADRVNQYKPEDGPRGREAVRQIVAERPGIWRVADIKREVQLRGWPSPMTAIDTAVARMAAAGEAEKIPGRKGLYKFGRSDQDDLEAASRTNLHRQEAEAA
jgi:hypothetical protein